MDYRIFVFFRLRWPRPDLRRLGLFWVRKAGRQRVKKFYSYFSFYARENFFFFFLPTD